MEATLKTVLMVVTLPLDQLLQPVRLEAFWLLRAVFVAVTLAYLASTFTPRFRTCWRPGGPSLRRTLWPLART
ncbi:MAG: hypothetical protein ACRDI2_23985 [Chloroflexota bacterium]